MSDIDGLSEIVNEPAAVSWMDRFSEAFRSSVPDIMQEFGEEKAQEFEDELKFKISAQLFKLQPLQRAYYLSKLNRGLDPRTLIATGEYLDAITHEQDTSDASVVTFRVGMRRGVHSGAHVAYAMLAFWLEHGTSRMPARPHWRPMIRQYQSESYSMANSFRTRLVQRVRQRLNS